MRRRGGEGGPIDENTKTTLDDKTKQANQNEFEQRDKERKERKKEKAEKYRKEAPLRHAGLSLTTVTV